MLKTAEDLGLPAGAVFDAGLAAWEVAARDSAGERHGEYRLYREDGSLKLRCRYTQGVLNGPFEAFHPDGTLARAGAYLDGELDGLVTAFASDTPGADGLRGCCVPPGAAELRSRYRAGRTLREVFYDSDGRPLTSSGTPWPERPAGLSEGADFDEFSGRWFVHTSNGPEADSGLTRYYSNDGTCVEEVEVIEGRKRAARSFDADGVLLEERHYDDASALSGRWYRRYQSPPYADARIVAEAGARLGSSVAGEFRFFDANGEVLRVVQRGAPLNARELEDSPALAATSAIDASLAESLAAEGRTREALLANARAFARDRDRTRFEALQRRLVVELEPAARAGRAEAAEGLEPPSALAAIEALLLGGDPARLLRLIASLLAWPSNAAFDLVEASLLLDPSSTRAHITRALLHFERGDVERGLADADFVDAESAEAAHSLREFRRIVFPEFSFWPARDAVESSNPELDQLHLAQPLEAIQRAVRVYATRLDLLRKTLSARSELAGAGAAPDWLPPDTAFLLTQGPIELRVERATIEDETENGVETSEVEIDERLAIEGLGVPALMRKARCDWAALTWLCWSVGLDRVALPEAIEEAPHFGAAVDRVTTRCFRVHDQLRLGGMVSALRGVPDFEWEGLPASELPRTLNEIAAQELLEVRALFFWLLFEQNLSPFQSDLRRV